MQRAAASTTSTPLTHAQLTVVGAMRLGRRKSPLATSVPGTQSEGPRLLQDTMSFPTQAMGAAAAVELTRRATVGDDRVADVAAWREYRLRNNGVSSRAGGEESRWQYAMRITASVFGASSALP